jgi:periplasmic divalent cation tolerance protein
MTEFVQITISVPSNKDAESIASILLERRLAGCVQVLGPMKSSYWWQGKIELAEEWLCVVKSRESLFDRIVSSVRDVHPYSVPEILSVPIVLGAKDYLDWLGKEVPPVSSSPA